MRLFQFIDKNQLVKVGLEMDGQKYNFSRLWEMYKDIKGQHRYPNMEFIQVMIEVGIFNTFNISEILTTVTDLRPINDIKLTEKIHFDVPISRPQKIICLGRNYKAHAEELNNEIPDEPIIFAKVPSTLLAHEGAIVIPRKIGRVDHEVELGVVISQTGKNIPVSKAYDYVAGYTIINDITARAIQSSDIKKKLPWMRSKSFDTFCPIGPFITPHDAVSNPHQLEITCKVNREVRQSANTSALIFKIPEILNYVSKHMTLFPGDIIATGTPEGISEIVPGDTVSCRIEELGILENRVVAE